MKMWQLIGAGGFTMYLLLLCSILSLTIITERVLYYYRRSRVKRVDFMMDVAREAEKENIKKILDMCRATDTPFASVVSSGFSLHNRSEKEISNAMEREITIETKRLETYTTIVATIGSTAVYIGLFGTVLGIIRAFKDIASSGASGINVVIGGISEALVCTAAGLCVAVPAVIAYNYFVKKIDNFVADMDLSASQAIDLICGDHVNRR